MSPAVNVVAVLGTGTMGAPMARNLAAAGLEVRAWNRSVDKARPLADDGIAVVGDPAEAVTGADAVITMLGVPDAVLEVAAAIGDRLGPDTIWAQMSTIGLEATDRCAELARERDVSFVDAPVLGTAEPARRGELIVLASGPDEQLDRLDVAFDAVGQRTVRLGPAGMGSRMKLVTNGWLVTLVEGLAETIALAGGLEVDPAAFLDVIGGGPLDSPYAQLKGKAMIEESFDPSFRLALARKDADLVAAAVERCGLELPMLEAVGRRFAEGVEAGHGDEDLAAIYLVSQRP